MFADREVADKEEVVFMEMCVFMSKILTPGRFENNRLQ